MDDTKQQIEELKTQLDETGKQLEEVVSEFNDFKNKIDPYNLLNDSLDVMSKVTINQTVRADILSGSITWNPGSLADGVGETSSSITVTDAKLGDFVWVSAPYDLQDMTITGYVQADDVVEVRIQNESGGTKDLAEGVWKVLVFKQKYENE